MSLPLVRKVINNFSYSINDKIGCGFSCEVFRGFDQRTKLPVAIKVVPKLTHRGAEQLELAEVEIRCLNLLRDAPNILELKHALQTKNSIYIITEHCARGTLRDLLASKGKLSETEAVHFMRQIIIGYRSIYGHGLVHRDLKPDNIFLTGIGQVRIGDFGFAIPAEECLQAQRENIGSPLFMSFEALTRNEYSYKSDIWALGVTLLELLTGKVPWRSKTEKQLVSELDNFKIDSFLPKGLTTNTQMFLKRTLVKDLHQRMGPQELFSFIFELTQSSPNQLDRKASNLKKTLSLEVIFENQAGQQAKMRKEGEMGKPIPKQKSDHSTQEHSKDLSRIGEIESKQQLEEQGKKPNIQKMVSSLTLEEKQCTPKTKLNRKYSLIKDEPLIDKAPPPSHPKVQREILMQVQSQINYFRFLFKLFKKMQEILKTTDEHIIKFKNTLLFTVYAKIEQIRSLKGLPADARQSLEGTAELANVLEVLRQYRERYQREEQKFGVGAAFEGEKEFIEGLCHTIRVLYLNVVSIEANSEEMQRKKGLILMLQDLVLVSKLYLLERQHDWALFHHNSNILKVVERGQSHFKWEEIKREVKRLINV